MARGAAYGVSQASPSGGINAVWVMPEVGGPCVRGYFRCEIEMVFGDSFNDASS